MAPRLHTHAPTNQYSMQLMAIPILLTLHNLLLDGCIDDFGIFDLLRFIVFIIYLLKLSKTSFVRILIEL